MNAGWLDLHVAAHGERLALCTLHERVSYAVLDARARSLARRLRGLGVRGGDRVALLLGNEVLFVELVHALLALGATLVPLNTRLLPAELAPLLRQARPRLLVAGMELLDAAQQAARELELRVCSAEELRAAAERPGALAEPSDEKHEQALLFTSGTTGVPKGVPLSLANQLASARASARCLGVFADDLWLCCLPLYHVGGLAIVLRSALYGTALELHARFDAHDVARALRERPIRLVSLVPTMLDRVLDHAGLDGCAKKLRVVLLGGGPIPPALLARCRALGLPVAPTYGLTEAASQVATLAPHEHAPADCAGRALPGTQIRIAGEDGAELPAGEPGEILVRGPQVMSGYLDRPEENARVLANGWLHTGDVGRVDAQGWLQVLERRTDLIVSGGENVYPAEVEAVLCAHPDVAEAGVIARSDPRWGRAVCAVVVPRAPGALDLAQLERFTRERLAGFKRPRHFEIASELPRTASGKLRRDALRRRFAACDEAT